MFKGFLSANWKTSLSSFLAAVGSFVALQPEGSYGGLGAWLKLLLPIGIGAMGLSARDFNVTSEESGAAPKTKPTTY